ncbi:hypothetical protein VP01_891g12 [Puccinia sorghi]|uniref:Uncharacterized protein n=1 Tax=Puccinia sorghi TaxID=27349 RepID=A0A0L6U826_9BASI|nr:hypothetical protein VP01_891g12 [Puccinia sorghi]
MAGMMRKIYRQKMKPETPTFFPDQSTSLEQPNGMEAPLIAMSTSSRHKKDQKKISNHRYAAAQKLFPKNSSFTTLFKEVQTVSDYKDNPNPSLPHTQIIPYWCSKSFTRVVHQLDKAAKQLGKIQGNTVERKTDSVGN